MTKERVEPKQSIPLRHPEYEDIETTAAVISKWREKGRWVGYELQFEGEAGTRCLTFAEIGALQEAET